MVLRPMVVLGSRFAKPFNRAFAIERDAPAVGVEQAKLRLRGFIAPIGGLAIPMRRLRSAGLVGEKGALTIVGIFRRDHNLLMYNSAYVLSKVRHALVTLDCSRNVCPVGRRRRYAGACGG